MTDDDTLLADQLRASLRYDANPSDQQIAAFRQQVEARFAAEGGGVTRTADMTARTHIRRRLFGRKPVVAGTLALAACVLVVLGVFVLQRETGTVEFDSVMTSPVDDAEAMVVVRAVGTGRIVEVRTDALPILPTGEYYEFWFVALDDRPGAPDRISAGTFHPDADGRSDVVMLAAVNPELYPRIEVTAEPGDGDPLPTGPIVLEATIEVE